MRDEWGRINNKAQAIRGLDKLRLAYILGDIAANPGKYPSNTGGWLEWLNTDSGDSIEEF